MQKIQFWIKIPLYLPIPQFGLPYRVKGTMQTVSYKIGARSIEEFWKGIQERIAKMFN